MKNGCGLRCLVAWLVAWPLLAAANCVDAQTSLEEVQSLVEARKSAQEALVLVRRSAQDFKNLLLRANDPVQAQLLRVRFEKNAKSYESHIDLLQKQFNLRSTDRSTVDVLLSERTVLFESYRQALKVHEIERAEEARAADKYVQGVDVKTLRTLENIIDVLSAQSNAAFQKLRVAIHRCSG